MTEQEALARQERAGLHWDMCLLAQTLEFSDDVRMLIQNAADEIERLQTRWRRLGALVEFGKWGVLIEDESNEVWADDGAALTVLLESPAIATEADQCERALRPNE